MNIQVRIPELTANLLNKPTVIEFTATECLTVVEIQNAQEIQRRSQILEKVENFLNLDVGTLSQHSIVKTKDKIVISDKI